MEILMFSNILEKDNHITINQAFYREIEFLFYQLRIRNQYLLKGRKLFIKNISDLLLDKLVSLIHLLTSIKKFDCSPKGSDVLFQAVSSGQ